MIYLLDTNVCIRYLNGHAPNVRQKLEALRPTDIAVCSVVKAELIYGAQKSNQTERTLQRQLQFLRPYLSLPFDDLAAAEAGRIRAYLATEGTPIGPYDLQIAAIALVHGLTLATHNMREFSRVPNLVVDDWE